MAERTINQGKISVAAAPTCDFPGCTEDAVIRLTWTSVHVYCQAHADTMTAIIQVASPVSSLPPALCQIGVIAQPVG